MVKIRIYKPDGKVRNIDDPIKFKTDGKVLTVTFKKDDGGEQIEVRTTLPYMIDEGSKLKPKKPKATAPSKPSEDQQGHLGLSETPSSAE